MSSLHYFTKQVTMAGVDTWGGGGGLIWIISIIVVVVTIDIFTSDIININTDSWVGTGSGFYFPMYIE